MYAHIYIYFLAKVNYEKNARLSTHIQLHIVDIKFFQHLSAAWHGILLFFN